MVAEGRLTAATAVDVLHIGTVGQIASTVFDEILRDGEILLLLLLRHAGRADKEHGWDAVHVEEGTPVAQREIATEVLHRQDAVEGDGRLHNREVAPLDLLAPLDTRTRVAVVAPLAEHPFAAPEPLFHRLQAHDTPASIGVVLLHMREAPEGRRGQKGDRLAQVLHAVVLVTQEGRLFAGQHRVGRRLLGLHIPLAGQQRRPPPHQHGGDQCVRPLHRLIEPLEIRESPALPLFDEADDPLQRHAPQRVHILPPRVIFARVYRQCHIRASN
ncbi:MAG: hypothetical protein BWX70_01791 [Verrucomicrobia bacterium ADurb.Bin070]|nr:MAG: hypothetical protein BWX70_01791 [Verrucomicrobia bacterium ADurb.Bin070]